jgi:hypothetical protein
VASNIWTIFMCVLKTMDKNNLVEGMDLNGNHDLSFCIDVSMVKHHRTPFFLSEDSCAKEILGCIHIYLCSTMQHSMEGQNTPYLLKVCNVYYNTWNYIIDSGRK